MKMALTARFRKIFTKWIGRRHRSLAYCPHFCRFCEFRECCSFDAEYEIYEELRKAYRKGVTHGTYKDVHEEGNKSDRID